MAEGLTLVADSSAWISFYRQQPAKPKLWMEQSIRLRTVLVPDLVLVDVLRGIDSEQQTKAIERDFMSFEIVAISGASVALQATKNYRLLRSKAFTIRGTVDLLIATWCIENKVPLLHADRDFDPFEKLLGLEIWRGNE